MDLCSQAVVEELLLITMLTFKTYLQLISITIQSNNYLQFISMKHSFQLIMTVIVTMIMIIISIIIIITCYSNGFVALILVDRPGVFSV